MLNLLLFLFLSLSSALDWGKWSWSNLGSSISTDVISGNPSIPPGCSVKSSTLTLGQSWAPRITISSDGGKSFYRFGNLLGKTVGFDVDISTTTCNCNAALYFIAPPAGSPIDYYCDGQTTCTEIDVMEANTHAFQVTPHCGTGGDACHWGCGVNYRSDKGYGPGGSAIDTKRSFYVYMKFNANGNTLTSISGGVQQSGKSGLSYTLTDQTCTNLPGNPKTYISGLANSIRGNLVLMVSFWRNGLDWLDGCSNGQNCPESCLFTLGNFTIS